jgi:hypothetical protein
VETRLAYGATHPHPLTPFFSHIVPQVFDGAKNGEHRKGSEWVAGCVLGFAAAAYMVYAAAPGVWAGALLGCAGAWIGLTIQHCGNHGAMSTKPWVNNALGMGMDLIGGSSLMWRYHHQVSEHRTPLLGVHSLRVLHGRCILRD